MPSVENLKEKQAVVDEIKQKLEKLSLRSYRLYRN